MNFTQCQSSRLHTLVKASSVDRFRQQLTLIDRVANANTKHRKLICHWSRGLRRRRES